jgi:membrane associated rhomboid family serine protease
MPRALRPRSRPARRRAPTGSGRPAETGTDAIQGEPALLWGLLYDAACAPLWLVGLLVGKARLEDGLRPLLRLYRFALASRMTVLLITLVLAVFLAEIATERAGLGRVRWLALFTLSPDGLRRGHYAPLLLHVFSHAGLGHLLGNVAALFVFGRVVERHLGPWRLLGAFLVSAACATSFSLLAQGLAGRSVPTLGASGAVAGLVALGVLLSPLAITFEALIPLPLFAAGWLAIAADLIALVHPGSGGPDRAGLVDRVDHPAHLGGYLSVLLFYQALRPDERQRARVGLVINLVTLLGLLLVRWLLR